VIITDNRTIEVNGLRLHYIKRFPERPQPDCPTALLLHGSSGNARVWDLFAPALARHIPTVALDLRGHGRSGRAIPPAYKAADYLGDLQQFMDRLDIRRAILIAHSMSVFHSIRYAAQNPDRVAKLVLVDIEATCRPEHIQLLNAAGLKPHPVFGSLEEAIAKEQRSAVFASTKALAGFIRSNLVAVEAGANSRPSLTYRFDRATLAQFDSYDEWSNLERIRCPVLVVYGEQSQLIRREVMEAMKSELNRAALAGVPQAGHLPMLDNPAAFEQAVLSFCLSETG
jgi:pimeloyl-ACP methyl ester carboxylesterase